MTDEKIAYKERIIADLEENLVKAIEYWRFYNGMDLIPPEKAYSYTAIALANVLSKLKMKYV